VTSNLVSGFDCRVLHTMVYCEAVRSAILATAWLLVMLAYRWNGAHFSETSN